MIHSVPPAAFTIFMGALLVIGAGAPIGTTIYGGIAIGHIKRSGGKIVGLPLAVADVLFFPLLLLGGIVAFPCVLVSGAFAPHPNAAALAMSVAFGVLGASVACFGVGRAVWRTIAGVTPPTPAVASTTSAEPRLSRLALWGAIWAGLGLLAAIFLLIAVSVTSSEHVTVTMPENGAAIFPEAPRADTPGWVWLLIVPIGVVAASAPIGATIFGAVAMAQIKRSRGQLYGLPLAAGAAIFFPCLILGSIGFALTHLACIAVWTQTKMAYVVDGQSGLVNHIAPNPALRPDMTFLVLDAIVALVVGFFTGPAMWHAIAGVKKEVDATTSPEQP